MTRAEIAVSEPLERPDGAFAVTVTRVLLGSGSMRAACCNSGHDTYGEARLHGESQRASFDHWNGGAA